MRPEPGPRVSLISQWTAALGDEAAAVLGPLYTDVLLGSLVHDLYVVRALAGDPTAIDWATTWEAGDGPGSVEFAGPLPAGGRLSVRWHHLAAYPAYREEVRVHDDAGSVELTFPAPYLLQHPTDLRVVDRAGPAERVTTFRSTYEAFEEQLVAFHGLVVDGGTPEIGVADGRRDVITCQRIARTLAAAGGIPIGGEAAHA
jgi:predicted dehydrogenase